MEQREERVGEMETSAQQAATQLRQLVTQRGIAQRKRTAVGLLAKLPPPPDAAGAPAAAPAAAGDGEEGAAAEVKPEAKPKPKKKPKAAAVKSKPVPKGDAAVPTWNESPVRAKAGGEAPAGEVEASEDAGEGVGQAEGAAVPTVTE